MVSSISHLRLRRKTVLGLQSLLVLEKLLVLSRVGGREPGLTRLLVVHEVGHDVDWYGEYDRAVVLSGDAVQGLEISQLKQEINK